MRLLSCPSWIHNYIWQNLCKTFRKNFILSHSRRDLSIKNNKQGMNVVVHILTLCGSGVRLHLHPTRRLLHLICVSGSLPPFSILIKPDDPSIAPFACASLSQTYQLSSSLYFSYHFLVSCS